MNGSHFSGTFRFMIIRLLYISAYHGLGVIVRRAIIACVQTPGIWVMDRERIQIIGNSLASGCLEALTIAKMPALIASGRSGPCFDHGGQVGVSYYVFRCSNFGSSRETA